MYINSDLAHGNRFALPGKCTPLLINILLVGWHGICCTLKWVLNQGEWKNNSRRSENEAKMTSVME